MGRNRWIQITLLIAGLILVSTEAYSATRKTVKHGQSARDIVNGQTATTGTISVPAGAVAFYGQDYVDRHEAKSLLTSGNIGSGAANGPGGGIGGSVRTKQAVTIKPAVVIPKSAIANLAVNTLKGGVVSVAATAAVMWAIDQIPGASFDPQTGLPVNAPDPIVPSATYWNFQSTNGVNAPSRYSSALQACSANVLSPQTNDYKVEGGSCWVRTKPSICPSCSFYLIGYMFSSSITCPTGGVNLSTYTCNSSAPLPTPFTNTDYAGLEETLRSVQNSEWLRDLIKASCNGSNNPAGCYESLVERRQLMGPASQVGPKTSTTTTTTSPNGATSTTTTTSQNTYTYNYGDNYYDYSTTTKTETTKDGETTVEETTDNQPDEEPTEEPSEEDFEGDFSDSDFPEVEPFYEQKYPDGLEGVWQSRKAEIDASAFISFLQSFVPNFSGSCPAYGLGFDLGYINFGQHGFDVACYVFEFIGIIFMVTALFTSRALIFGG